LGALILQNEKVRAVGNMNVNARGDILDSANKVIMQKNKQVQRQYATKTNVTSDRTVHASSTTARKNKHTNKKTAEAKSMPAANPVEDEVFQSMEPAEAESAVQPPAQEPTEPVIHSPRQLIPQGGLAGAIARSKLIKQEKEKTLRQQQQQGLKKV